MTHPFVMDVDAVDLNKVPMRTLRTGAKMPAVGIGTFGSDRFDDAAIAKAVSGALRVGYRLVDCAACYGNEAAIGAALAKALSGGLARSELFVVSKVWNDMHAPDDVIAACKRSIDAFNQRRNDFMEKVDACIVAMCLPHLPAPAEGRRPRYNTESVGAAVDRLSIISLKAYHMREETERTDVDAAHIEACRKKLTTLLDQRDELFTAILELIDDYAAGRKRPRVYYQFKMYNDPRLNPALYKNRQS